MKKCPNCKSSDITFTDCGYTTFDVGTARCENCGYQLSKSGNRFSIEKEWNSDLHKDSFKVFKKLYDKYGKNWYSVLKLIQMGEPKNE